MLLDHFADEMDSEIKARILSAGINGYIMRRAAPHFLENHRVAEGILMTWGVCQKKTTQSRSGRGFLYAVPDRRLFVAVMALHERQPRPIQICSRCSQATAERRNLTRMRALLYRRIHRLG